MASNIVYLAFMQNLSITGTKWNNLDDYTAGLDPLKDEDGNNTAWDISITTQATQETGLGVSSVPTGDAAWVDQQNISTDAWYNNSNTAAFAINGLNNSKTYDFEFYCSYDIAPSHIMEFSYDAFSTTHGELESAGNSSNTLLLTGISPATGTITITYRDKAGATLALLNAARITEQSGVSDVNYNGSARGVGRGICRGVG